MASGGAEQVSKPYPVYGTSKVGGDEAAEATAPTELAMNAHATTVAMNPRKWREKPAPDTGIPSAPALGSALMPLSIAFDATALFDAPTGVGIFAHEVLTRFAARSDLAVTAYAATWRGRGRLPELVPVGVAAASRPMAAQPLRQLWIRFDRPAIEWWTGPVDVVHGPNFVVPPTRAAVPVVTVHDLTPLRFPELANRDTRAYPALIRRAIARGAWVHTVSRFVADEVVENFSIPPERVVTVENGVSSLPPLQNRADARAGCELAGGDRYLLALGTIEPRKNLPLLVEAFGLLAAEDPELRLVVAGPEGWGADAFVEAVARCPHRGRIRRLGYVSDEQRAALLRGAAVFTYPSLYEGFGLPPLEAMSAETPVVCSDAGALPEVVGEAAEMVAVAQLDAATLATAIALVLGDDERRATLVRAGTANVARFGWARCADGLVDLYHHARAS